MKKIFFESLLLGISIISFNNTAFAKTETVSIKHVDVIDTAKDNVESKSNLLKTLNDNQDVLDIESVKLKNALDAYKKDNLETLKTLNLKGKVDEYSSNLNKSEKIEVSKQIMDSANKESELNKANDAKIEAERVKAEQDKIEAERAKEAEAAAKKASETSSTSSTSNTTIPTTTTNTQSQDTSGGSNWGTRTTHNGYTASSPKEWIAMSESGGNYEASNGQYFGRYQLGMNLYANYDTTPSGQEKAADAYVAGRYGTWQAAYEFWVANHWY